jgi:putative sigma-54 modulation protein
MKHDGVNHKDNIEIKVSMHIPKVSFQAECYCYKVNEGIEAIVSKLKKQIQKYKSRHEGRERQLADLEFKDSFNFLDLAESESFETGEDNSLASQITKHTLFSDLTPLTEEKALETMLELGHEFMVFVNQDTDRYNIIYKRHNHTGYAVIELETQNGILDLINHGFTEDRE